jgi:hypothetical protein
MQAPGSVNKRDFDEARLVFIDEAYDLNLDGRHAYLPPHHCLSHGTPSLSPSIPVSGQCSMKYVASAQEVI